MNELFVREDLGVLQLCTRNMPLCLLVEGGGPISWCSADSVMVWLRVAASHHDRFLPSICKLKESKLEDL